MATTTGQIRGNLNRGLGGTIPLKGALPWLGANLFDGAYGAYDLLNNNVLSPINETITGNQQPVYNYRGEYQDRLRGFDLPIDAEADASAVQLLAPAAQPKQLSLAARELARRKEGGYVPAYEKYPAQINKPAQTTGNSTSRTGNPPQQPVGGDFAEQMRAVSRPYAYQQQPVRNAFTMGAPADDARARIKAEEAIKRFNIAEESYKSNKTPEAEAAFKEAQADADRWGKWAAMPANTRKQVLMAGERAANAAQGRENFATLRNEMDTPGAAELLAYAAAVNSGGPAVTRQTDGTATVSGRYGSGAITGYVPRGTRTAQSTINDNLLLDQAAQAGVAPSRAADILKNRRF